MRFAPTPTLALLQSRLPPELERNLRPVRLAGVFGAAFAFSTVSAQRGDTFDTPLRSPAETRALFHVPPGFEVQLVAAEPELEKPMNLAFDASGRVWVTGSSLYPWPARRDANGQLIASFDKHWDDNQLAFRAAAFPPEPSDQGSDSVRVLSDFGPDGRARTVSTFATGLNIPIGILPLPRAPEAKGDSVLVYSIPAIWRLTDTDGDGSADLREKLYDGFGFKDTHGMSSNYWLWFDGWVYGTHGFSNVSEIVDRSGNITTLTSGNTYRFRPDGSSFERFSHGQTNPFGLAFDSRGDLYTADSHSKPVYLIIPGGYYEGINREHDGLGFAPPITLDDHGSSAIAGIAHYSATDFPLEFQHNLFNGNPVTRRINRARLDWRGSSPTAVRQADFLSSDDPAFRPVQVKLGPDGALWIADFYNPIIGHYEVPLTHPSRDRRHGRIWRIVWRGLDGSVQPTALPDLTRETPAGLVTRLADPNLVVRSLALPELLARTQAPAQIPALRAALARILNGSSPPTDDTIALPLFFALERLGAVDYTLLRDALTRRNSIVALAALRVLATRPALPENAEALFTSLLAAPAPEHAARVAAEIFQRLPEPWQPALILTMLTAVSPTDFELHYALKLALKTHALGADAATLQAWSATTAATADRVAEVCLAVPTPAAARFLLGYLERSTFSSPRSGEFARHAVMQLSDDEIASIVPLMRTLMSAPITQRLSLAEGLASIAAKPGRSLPDVIENWMHDQLVAALKDRDAAIALRAINALKPLSYADKTALLGSIARDAKIRDANRNAALRALAPNHPDTEAAYRDVLASNGSTAVRRTAAELLGTVDASPESRAALAAAFITAPADLALALATGLAKSDAGAAELIELVVAGHVRPTLLRHRYVALAFEKRPAPLRERALELTRALPPEDARLDAVIAQRLRTANTLKPDGARGAPLFTLHCAACHRFRDQGGAIGPSLDGVGSRQLTRLVEDVLDPSRNVDPAFRVTTLTLKNGGTTSGLNHRNEGERVQLTDPASGQEIVVDQRDVSEVTRSPLSPMPTFESTLSEGELFDLLEFLRTPAPTK